MFSHIALGSNDLAASKTFYDAVLATLAAAPATVDDRGRLLYQHGGAILIITTPLNGEAACHANGGTVGFACASPEQADAWHAAGLANGGTACEDPPGERQLQVGTLYLAYLPIRTATSSARSIATADGRACTAPVMCGRSDDFRHQNLPQREPCLLG